MADIAISLQDIVAGYGSTPVLSGVDLALHSGELHTLLGPSGCGKTTMLRLVAGFLAPQSGRILLEGRDITHLPPEKRHMGVVFQNYALFPHMTVGENIAYGLKMAHVGRAERARRVADLLYLVGLSGMEKREAPALSGGQQQRVAIARALAPSPSLLLLDEPMANLDVGLRQTLRQEIKRIQKATGVTTLFITHDQAEALSLSDRISVMNEGAIEQTGTPREIYERPATAFVASFVGTANAIDGDLVRPECLRLVPLSKERPSESAILAATVAALRYEGFSTVYTVHLDDAARAKGAVEVLMLNNAAAPVFSVGERVAVERVR